MDNIEALEKRLWGAADQLRANSGLASNEYFMPVMGLIFLRHAFNRFAKVKAEIEPKLPKRQGVPRMLTKDDFARKSAIYLRDEAQYPYLVSLPADKDPGVALNKAMEDIEEDYPVLNANLPKEYTKLEPDVLRGLLRIFNDQALNTTNGDVFGRIYEYFLMKFAAEKAHDGGEFYTPVSIVQTIVNVIEPDHGKVFDPACGSGGMLVQTSHFLEKVGKPAHEAVTFYGQEKNATTIRFTKMNLAVHGLEGIIKEGNTYYEDKHNLLHKADFVMANPPFNVDEVDAGKVKSDPRLPFGLPGVNKKGAVSNGNYLWISYFWSYLNPKGRAGFVMSSQASAAGHGEKKVRQKIVESGDVDVMISIRSGFFYTRAVPCELWFLDRGKPKEKRNRILMIDARNIARRMEGSRRVWEFSPEQQKNLTAIVWLYRGKTERYLGLVKEYLRKVVEESGNIEPKLKIFDEKLAEVRSTVSDLANGLTTAKATVETKKVFKEALSELDEAEALYRKDCSGLLKEVAGLRKKYGLNVPESNSGQLKMQKECEPIAERLRGLVKQVDHLFKLSGKAIDAADAHRDDDEKNNDGKNDNNHHNNQRSERRKANQLRKELDEVRKTANEQLKLAAYFDRQVHWLQSRFPDAKLADVEGLVKLVDVKEIAKNDWSLSPGRYVGVAPVEEDEDFDFEEALQEIHNELGNLNRQATELATTIQRNFEDLVI